MNRDQDQPGSFSHSPRRGRHVGPHPPSLVDLHPPRGSTAVFWVIGPVGDVGAAAGHPLLGRTSTAFRRQPVCIPLGTRRMSVAGLPPGVRQSIIPRRGICRDRFAAAPKHPRTLGNIVINQFEGGADASRSTAHLLPTQLFARDGKIRVDIYSRASGGEFHQAPTATVESAPQAFARSSTNQVLPRRDTCPAALSMPCYARTVKQHGPAFAALTRIARLPDCSAEPRSPSRRGSRGTRFDSTQSCGRRTAKHGAAISEGDVREIGDPATCQCLSRRSVYRDVNRPGRRCCVSRT